MSRAVCRICSEPELRATIDGLLADERSFLFIERQTGIGRRPIANHARRCAERPMKATDFATAVRNEAAKLLAEGKLHVRTTDGLAAQGLLDRRAEKAADRQLLVEMARLLSGAGKLGTVRPPDQLLVRATVSDGPYPPDAADPDSEPLLLPSVRPVFSGR